MGTGYSLPTLLQKALRHCAKAQNQDKVYIESKQTYPTKPGHFSRTLAKGPNTTTWIWNLHADAHDFDSHTSDLEEISRKVFSAHFGQLGIILIWLSGCDTMKHK